MEKILIQIQQTEPSADISLLKTLIHKIRPGIFNRNTVATKRIEKLIELLKANSSYKNSLQHYVFSILSATDANSLLTESGIHSNEGFFSESFTKLAHILLPPSSNPESLRDLFQQLFYKKTDFIWIEKIPNELLEELFALLFSSVEATQQTVLFKKSLNALEILTHRITSIGLDPEIIKRKPHLIHSDSPFLQLNKKLIDLIQDAETNNHTKIDDEKLTLCFTLLHQCEVVSRNIREEQKVSGAGLALTFILHRMHQHIRRIKTLLTLTFGNANEKPLASVLFFKQLVKFENKKNSIKELFLKNIGMLAYQITEHAGKTGEHYITSSKKEYIKMLYSAMGGGFIVAFLTWFKAAIYYLKLAPFGEAFLYSMNYSFGFIGIHVTHSTLATKQPAMTASRIAASLDIKGSVEEAIKNLSELIVKTFRSQFIAFVGNMFVAFPVALAIAIIYFWISGDHILGDAKAFKIIKNIHPWESFSLMHGAIAGVCLFLSGIISGYYDNAVKFKNIPERLNHQPFLRFILPKSWLKKFSNYIGNNLGSLAGNFFLGIFLGSMGTLGAFLGLPLDIQHVTFASGNFGLALASVGTQIDLMTFVYTCIGIVGIGFMNFFFSFGLAIFVAIQSRRVAFNKTGLLFKFLLMHLFNKPSEFLFPPADTVLEETESTT